MYLTYGLSLIPWGLIRFLQEMAMPAVFRIPLCVSGEIRIEPILFVLSI
jgi:hypothetical protein